MKKQTKIKIQNLDNFSWIDKEFDCSECDKYNSCIGISECPTFKYISQHITRTSYNLDGNCPEIITATYNHDFRRALCVVNFALDMCKSRVK